MRLLILIEPNWLLRFKRCDGERSVAAIVDDLVRKFTAPRDTILTDVTALVQDFTDKGVLEA